MPVNWRWCKIYRLTRQRTESRRGLSFAVCVEETESPRAHGDVTIRLDGGNGGRRGSHGNVGLILIALNSYRIQRRLVKDKAACGQTSVIYRRTVQQR